MKKLALFLLIIFGGGFVFSISPAPVEAKSYGYKSFGIPGYNTRNYNYGGQLRYQSGYYKPSSGSWVQSHFKTGPDGYKWNNRKSLYGW